MIDGKKFGVISDTYTQTCCICGATPKMMNQLGTIWSHEVKPHLFEYEISNLHAWIRCLDCSLHISYRLELKEWQIFDRNEQKIKQRKTRIINMLKTKMNVVIDIPKPGYGTTNDGNTVRRLFPEFSLASSITDLNGHFLKRLYVILLIISCGFAINSEAFSDYARKGYS